MSFHFSSSFTDAFLFFVIIFDHFLFFEPNFEPIFWDEFLNQILKKEDKKTPNPNPQPTKTHPTTHHTHTHPQQTFIPLRMHRIPFRTAKLNGVGVT
jgi:hypothetical protein